MKYNTTSFLWSKMVDITKEMIFLGNPFPGKSFSYEILFSEKVNFSDSTHLSWYVQYSPLGIIYPKLL